MSSAVSAQEAASDGDVRRQSQQILSEPEFRYFEHLGDSPDRPETRGGRRDSSGSSGSGGQTGPDGQRKGKADGSSKSRTKKQNDKSSSSDSNNGGSNSSPSSSSFGGLGSLGTVVGTIFHLLAYLVLLAVCGLIVFLIVQAILSRETSASAGLSLPMNFDLPQEEDHSPGEIPADAYLAKAHELAQQRRYREAIGQLLWGGMSSIERAELIRHRRGLTLRDYLRSLRGRSPHYEGFKLMIRLYEPIGFGRRVASHQTFQDALAGYQRTVDGLA